MLQIRTAQYILFDLEYTIGDFEDELGLGLGHLLYQDPNPKRDTSQFVFSLDLKFGFSRLPKVYLNYV